MIIRKFQSKDYDALIDLWEQAELPFKPKGRDRKEEFEKQIKKSGNLYLSAFQGNRLIGFIQATHNRRKGWINRLAVHPDFQKKSIASLLIQKAEEFFIKEGVDIFACLIEDWNERSMKLFEKSGYKSHQEISYYTKRNDPDV